MLNPVVPGLIILNCILNFWMSYKSFTYDGQELAGMRNRLGKASAQIGKPALSLLAFYKRYISPCLPRACRFEPTCSVYMYQAIQKKGLLMGLFLGAKRLLRCHPFCDGGVDPVP
jgi:uncharacterized protein